MRRIALTLGCLTLLAALGYSQPKGWFVQKGGFPWLRDVLFINSNTGFVVGFKTSALRTTDGGTTWKQMTLPKGIAAGDVFSSISFSAPTNGCISYGTNVLHTLNGGDSWVQASIDIPGTVSHFVFTSASRGYATGGTSIGGNALLQTSDGGASWHRLAPPVDSADLQFWGADFRDNDHGMLITRTRDECYDLWQTTDACGSWQKLTERVEEPCLYDLVSITHLGAHSWVIGGHGIVRSTDDGVTWEQVSHFPAPHHVSFADSLNGFASGDLPATVYRTTNGGASWFKQPLSSDTGATINALCAASPTVAFAVAGHYPTNTNDDVVLKTTDGGGESTPVDETAVPNSQSLVVFPNPASTFAFAIGESGANRTIDVVDRLGRTIWSGHITPGSTRCEIPVHQFSSGIYWLTNGSRRATLGVVR